MEFESAFILGVLLLVFFLLFLLLTSTGDLADTSDYTGSASAGDMWEIQLNRTAKTLTYTNLANDSTGIVPYTENVDGTLEFEDPDNNLIRGLEVKDYFIMLQVNKAGASGNTKALVLGLSPQQVEVSDLFVERSMNYMQFRTSSGGVEIGFVTTSNDGLIHSGFWPFGQGTGSDEFVTTSQPITTDMVTTSAKKDYLLLTDNEEDGTNYVFKSEAGHFVVDTTNGSIFAMQQASSSAFDSTSAGTYKSLAYRKENAYTDEGNVESGDISMVKLTIVIDADGGITITNTEDSTEYLSNTLVPFASMTDLTGTGKVDNECKGLFSIPADSGEHLFVSFLGDSLIFSSFVMGDGPYNYMYGAALKQ
jgi:hypothetical protein